MTYQYQDTIKKSEKNQETDLFNYQQKQHQEVTKEFVERVDNNQKEQQVKKNETGYEPTSTKEIRDAHNKKMEELYGVDSKKQKVEKTLNEAEKITQKKLQPGQGLFTESLFPTLIHRGHLPVASKINPDLIKHCYQLKKDWEEKGEPVLNRSVKNGWQSKPDIQDLPELKEFSKCILDATNFIFKQLKVPEEECFGELDTMWYNICPKGGFNAVHVHPGAFLSGVYYLQTPEGSGDLVLHDPRKASQSSREPGHIARPSLHHFKPQIGDVLIFPAWLEHSVEPNYSNEDRISISFNIAWRYKPGQGYLENFVENKKKEQEVKNK